MTAKRVHIPAAKLVLAVLLACTLAGCDSYVGVGVSVPAPGGWYGPWGGGYAGVPIWP